MSLNYQDIEAAVLSEKDAGGFAKLMKDFQALGVEKYDYLVADGLYRYYDSDSSIDLQMNAVPKSVEALGDSTKIKLAVQGAQAGKFDFERFCELAGQAGVLYWRSDLIAKNVSYFDTQGNALLIEPIPGI